MFPAALISGSRDFTQHLTSGELILIHSADAFTAVKRLVTRVNTRVIYAIPVTFPLHPTKFRAISVLSSIILPLQTFFSRVLLLRQQLFWSENLPPERPTTTIAIKTQVFMFRYELINSTRKFTIVAEIVSLLKKIYKRDAPFRAVFKVKTLAFRLILAKWNTYRET